MNEDKPLDNYIEAILAYKKAERELAAADENLTLALRRIEEVVNEMEGSGE
jgi:exonuclease VII small subunit